MNEDFNNREMIAALVTRLGGSVVITAEELYDAAALVCEFDECRNQWTLGLETAMPRALPRTPTAAEGGHLACCECGVSDREAGVSFVLGTDSEWRCARCSNEMVLQAAAPPSLLDGADHAFARELAAEVLRADLTPEQLAALKERLRAQTYGDILASGPLEPSPERIAALSERIVITGRLWSNRPGTVTGRESLEAAIEAWQVFPTAEIRRAMEREPKPGDYCISFVDGVPVAEIVPEPDVPLSLESLKAKLEPWMDQYGAALREAQQEFRARGILGPLPSPDPEPEPPRAYDDWERW